MKIDFENQFNWYDGHAEGFLSRIKLVECNKVTSIAPRFFDELTFTFPSERKENNNDFDIYMSIGGKSETGQYKHCDVCRIYFESQHGLDLFTKNEHIELYNCKTHKYFKIKLDDKYKYKLNVNDFLDEFIKPKLDEFLKEKVSNLNIKKTRKKKNGF